MSLVIPLLGPEKVMGMVLLILGYCVLFVLAFGRCLKAQGS